MAAANAAPAMSFAAMAQKETAAKQPLRTVQLDGQVVLKIVKHCQENSSATSTALVTGQLLGLDVGQTLEVTDCFPFPVRKQQQGAGGAGPGQCLLGALIMRSLARAWAAGCRATRVTTIMTPPTARATSWR